MLQTLNVIWSSILHEFSDLPSIAEATKVICRLVISLLLGGLIGYEREVNLKSAGLRTHMLVALGATLFILVPQQYGATPADVSRVLQGLISGIGFLGAGAIMISQQRENKTGLTTASTVWITAAIGVSVGMGLEMTATIYALATLFILAIVPKALKK